MIYRVIIMKNFRKNAISLIKIAATASAFLFCLTETQIISETIYDAIIRCINVIIPSLYAMMIVSGLLVRSNLTSKSGRIFSVPGRALFGMGGNVLPIFLLSMFAGYPIGTSMLCAEVEKGSVSRKDAEIFSGVCFGAGPAFIFGCISSQLYGSETAGKIILLSAVSANVILAVLISFITRKNNVSLCNAEKLKLSSETFTESIVAAGHSMANICFMVVAFSVLTAFLETSGTIELLSSLISSHTNVNSQLVSGAICALLDVTNLKGMPAGNYEILPLLSALASFGGVCVIMQIAVLARGRISLIPLILLRTAAAIISAVICRIISPYMLVNETVSASSAKIALCNNDSPIPSILLIIMTLMLFAEYEKIYGKKSLANM